MTFTLICSTNGGELRVDHDIDEIDSLIASPDNLVWLDIDREPTDSAAILQREFGFHPLAIEDVQHRHQRPKIDTYDDYAFVVLYAFADPSTEDLSTLTELNVFIGPNYLVTAHDGPIAPVAAARERWEKNPAAVGGKAALLLHAIFDEIVDDYFPFADVLSDRIEDLETGLFEAFDEDAVKAIFGSRREILHLRRTLAPMRDVALVLARRDLPFTDSKTSPYFEDVYDHVIRLTDTIDISRDLLAGALDTYLSMTSNRLNRVVKTLTGASIILMTMAVFAGIWGMNFHHMPELEWRLGYPLALGTIFGSAGLLFWFFRTHDYL